MYESTSIGNAAAAAVRKAAEEAARKAAEAQRQAAAAARRAEAAERHQHAHQAASDAPSRIGSDSTAVKGGTQTGTSQLFFAGTPFGPTGGPMPIEGTATTTGAPPTVVKEVAEDTEVVAETTQDLTGKTGLVASAPANVDKVRQVAALAGNVKDTGVSNTQVINALTANPVARVAAPGLSVIGAVGGGAQAAKGISQLIQGDLIEGGVNTAQGGLNAVSGVGHTVNSINALRSGATAATAATAVEGGAAAATAIEGGAAATTAAAGVTLATKLGGGAAAVGGVYQAITADTTEGKVLGGVKAAAGVAMIAGGPVTIAVGGAVLAGVAIYENREAIADAAQWTAGKVADGAGAVAGEVADGAHAVADAAGDVADKAKDIASDVKDKASDAFDKLTPW